jgi:hypothetical protein
LLVGCGGSDPCDPFPGRTCLSLEVRGPALTLDQIGVDALTGFVLSGRSPDPPRAFTLPVQVAVLPPDHQFAGSFALEVRGLVRDAVVASDSVHSTVAAGDHQRLIADLQVPDGGLPDLAQPFVADLAGADFAGADLAQPDLAGAGAPDLASFNGWTVEMTPDSTGFINSIWGTSSSNVYALNVSGTVLHSTGDGTWTVQRPGADSGVSFSVISGSGPDDLYAGGQILNCSGTCPSVLLHSTGDGNWATVPSTPVESTKGLSVMAILALAKNDIRLGVWGGTHTIFHSTDASVWTPETQPGTPEGLMSSFYAAAANQLFAASNSGTIYQSAGDGTWSFLDVPTGCGDMFLTGLSATNLYVVCDTFSNQAAQLWHWPGTGKFVLEVVDDMQFEDKPKGIGASGPSDLYAVFGLGLKHSTGDGHWKEEPLPPVQLGFYDSIWVAPDGQVFVGADFAILHKRP